MTSCLETRPVRVRRPWLLPFPGSRAHHLRDVTPPPTIAYAAAMVNPSGRALEDVAVRSSGAPRAARPPAS